jgi:cytochrome c peroxidase
MNRCRAVALVLPCALACASNQSPEAHAPPATPDAAAAASTPTLTDAERAAIHGLSPLGPPPADPTNRYADDPRAATLGQRLFFDVSYSGPLALGDDGTNGGLGTMGQAGRISCRSCHLGDALDDRRSRPGTVSLGADYLGRNAPPLVNASHYRWVNWAGRFSAQWELPLAVAENAKNMNSDRLRVVHVLARKYRADYEAVFGPLDSTIEADPARFPASGKPKAMGAADGPWELMTDADRALVNRAFVNFGKALEAYLRLLVDGGSRFDAFVAGKADALSASELDGLRLFVGKAGCVSCHGGPQLSDQQFHDIGIRQQGPQVPAMDLGRFADVPPLLASAFNSAGAFSDDAGTGRLAGLTNPPPETAKGQFRTPSLRNVAVTAPYMHAGQLASLPEVIDYYDRGGDEPAAGTKDPLMKPLGLTVNEKAALVAFLQTLTGTPVAPVLLQDTSAP